MSTYKYKTPKEDSQGRHHLGIPWEVFERLRELASELDFADKSHVSITAMLAALAEVDAEKLYEFFESEGLLPTSTNKRTDSLWR